MSCYPEYIYIVWYQVKLAYIIIITLLLCLGLTVTVFILCFTKSRRHDTRSIIPKRTKDSFDTALTHNVGLTYCQRWTSSVKYKPHQRPTHLVHVDLMFVLRHVYSPVTHTRRTAHALSDNNLKQCVVVHASIYFVRI